MSNQQCSAISKIVDETSEISGQYSNKVTRTIDAASEKVYFLSVGLLFSGRASQPGSWRPWRGIEDLVNSEQRRRLTRLVNRFTKLLGEAGKHKNQLKKNGQRLAAYIAISLIDEIPHPVHLFRSILSADAKST